MVRPHIIRQGEYLAKVAAAEGFDAAESWGAPGNEDLVRARASENALCPGDVLLVPDKARAPLVIPIGGATSAVAVIPKCELRVKIELESTPASEEFILQGMNGEEIRGVTDGDGVVVAKVSTLMREAVLLLPGRDVCFPIMVGGLDCASTDSGGAMRLRNLGYSADATSSAGELEVQGEGALCPFTVVESGGGGRSRAVEAYQKHVGAPPTGVLDEETRGRLARDHGA